MNRPHAFLSGIGCLLVLTGACAACSDAMTTTALPADHPAPSSYLPVIRDGKQPQPTIGGTQGGFSAATQVRYPDGVSISVAPVKQAVEEGRGAGAFPERAYTVLSVTLDNGSRATVDLTQVVVTTTYGAHSSPAAPVYIAAAQDFSQLVKPGRSASARYAFAVPVQEAAEVVTLVDFDDRHLTARFVGAIR